MAVGVRYLILLLVILSAMVDYLARLNVNVTIVSMVKPLDRNITSYQVCFVSQEDSGQPFSIADEPTALRYDWSLTQQSAILGSFFYTYALFQIPLGRVAHAYGGKWILCLGLLGTGVINLLTPILSTNYHMFLASRLVMGIYQAGLFPACFGILYFWFPKHERSFAFGLLNGGSTFGSILASSLSGYLCDYGFAGGWPSVYYISGILALIVFVLTTFLITSKPRDHWLISETELQLINPDPMSESKNTSPVPWAAILSSIPFWAISFTLFAQAFAFYLCSAEIPTYLSQILQIDSTTNGLFNGLFNFSMMITNCVAGPISEYLIRKKFTSVTNIRKFMAATMLAGMTVFILLITRFNCNQLAAVILFTLFGIFKGLDTGTFMPAIAEMSQEYTTVVYSMFNTVGINAAYVAPSVAGFILDSGISDLLFKWNLLFYVTAAVLIAGLVATNFIEAKRQPFDMINTETLANDKN